MTVGVVGGGSFLSAWRLECCSSKSFRRGNEHTCECALAFNQHDWPQHRGRQWTCERITFAFQKTARQLIMCACSLPREDTSGWEEEGKDS